MNGVKMDAVAVVLRRPNLTPPQPQKCGCEIETDYWPDSAAMFPSQGSGYAERIPKELRIVYCPLHEAAGEMVMRLRSCLNMMRNSEDTERFEPMFLDSLEELLAKASGAKK